MFEPMSDVVECTCCKECKEVIAKLEGNGVNCITQLPSFNSVCLDVNVLHTAYYDYRQDHGHHHDEQIQK